MQTTFNPCSSSVQALLLSIERSRRRLQNVAGRLQTSRAEPADDLQIRVAGFVGNDIATGGFTYVDHVFPETDATFEVFMFSPAECLRDLDEIGVYPNLGEDKIFNP
jgi:hypothetical protein